MPTCIYCDKNQPSEAFSLEHILPRRLGGELCCGIFKTRRVCRACNSHFGLFVDGAFLKSWFAQNHHAAAARNYLDLENGCALPLIYFGKLEQLPFETSDVAELWLTPSGDRVYHIHPEHDERYISYAGGNPIAAKNDRGTAMLLSATTNQLWLKTSLLSFARHFSRARRVLANVSLQSDRDRRLLGVPPAESDVPWINAFLGADPEPRVRTAIIQGFEQRFLAKIALGLGFTLLGEQFLSSPYAGLLRQAAREPDFKQRQALPIPWSSYWQDEDAAADLLSWYTATTIAFVPAPPYLVLSLGLFGRTPLRVPISDDPSIWANPVPEGVGRFGSVYVVIPQRRFFSGRVALPEFLSERAGEGGVPKLAETREWTVDQASLPPYQDPIRTAGATTENAESK